jgi:hypothetical protein
MATNNYLKTKTGEFFFFDSRDEDSRSVAWKRAHDLEPKPENISIWLTREEGRYPDESAGPSHPVVGASLSPISHSVRVVGYALQRLSMLE